MTRLARAVPAGLYAVVMAGLAALLVACGGGKPASAPADAGKAAVAADPTTLRRGNGPEPDTLDPQRSRTDASFNIQRDLFEGLTAVGPDGDAVPAAAESWTVSADGLEYTFRLRDGLRWSNGDPVRAADFVAGMRRLVDPATASPYAQVLEPVLNAPAIVAGKQAPDALGVTAPDDRTVVIRLANPAPYLLGILAHPSTFPVHGPSLAQHGAEYARPGKLVSNGAYVLEDWVVGSHVAAVRNTHYWNDAATGVSRVRYLHHSEAGTEFRQYRAAPAVRVDPGEPAGRAARVAAAQRLLLRLQPDAAAVQGQPGLAARAVVGDRPRPADEIGDRARRGTGLRLGAARRRQLHAAAVRLRGQAL